ncbi:MAG TPA: peptidase MA family metallohydrolase [Candidatus Omnitrophota bacterium]|nr:peptidase MA family metallohydrolase [Candidatus Omnitrophota bacterium]HPT06880.1 peptidase MA family metallohydrolase [Candidatus Omnitrophota bacterium]
MLKRRILCAASFVLWAVYAPAFAEVPWNVEKSTHFLIYYKNAPADFIAKVVTRAEDYYDRIADDLGFRRMNFWLWENRASMYIYDDAVSYQQATGEPAWSGGATEPRSKVIQTFAGANGFLETILPHELGHIIFGEFVGFDNPAVPVWLEEGVASYEQKERFKQADLLVRAARAQGALFSYEQLAEANPHMLSDDRAVTVFYAESVSIVDFMLKEFGTEAFVGFCQNLRDYKNLNRAVVLAFSPMASAHELFQLWEAKRAQ